MKRRCAILLVLVLASGLIAGCGDDDDDRGGGDESSEVQLQQRTKVELAEDTGTRTPSGVDVLDELQQLKRGRSSASVPSIRGSEGLSIAQWLDVVNRDVASYWQSVLNDAGYTFEGLSQVIFTRPVRSACGRLRFSVGPVYCPADTTIYLPDQFFADAGRQFGDAGIAVVVAHESGHHVQNVLGIFELGLRTIQEELQADCLAGVWAASVLQRGAIEQGDVGEILTLIDLSGDRPGRPVDDPGAHGNAQLRAEAFFQGYEGDAGSCPIPPVPSA